MADRIGQQLGNYRLTRLLGQGGFAEVYLGEHIYLKTQAAVKVLYTQLAREDFEDFQAEARTVANLEHPNIVRVLEFGIEGAVPFLVMSYAPNGSLRQRHPRGTPLPLPLILQYVRQVADALQYAHDEKLIHRDIKPENMLLGRRNEVLLSDFGIAIISQTSRSKSVQEVIGTVAYMSPEMLQGKPKAASDQYALGIVVYEWLCGQRPFHGAFTELASQHMFVPPPLLREKNATISPDLEQVVMTALAKVPQQRFSSVRAFAHALEQAGQSAAYQPTVYAPPPAQPFQPTQPATLPNSPRQPTVPPAESQFPQPLAGTSTQSQPISSPMLNIPSSPVGKSSGPTVLSSDASSRPGLLTPPSSQPFPLPVAAAPSSQSLQPTIGAAPSNSSSQPSSPLPPTVLAAPAIAAPTDLKTPAAQTLEPTVAVPPPAQTPPSTTVIPPTVQAVPPPTRSAKHYRTAVILGVFLSLVSMLFMDLIPIWAGVYPYPTPLQIFPSLVMSLIAGVTLGKSRAALPASLLAGLLIGISGGIFMVVKYASILPYLPQYAWALLVAGTVACGPLSWLAAWIRTHTRPLGQNKRRRSPAVTVFLILLALILLGGASFDIYHDVTEIHSGTLQSLDGVAWSGSQFVVVGYGTILTSPDGRTWTPQTPNISTLKLLDRVVWSGSQFVAVGSGGTILTSPDGRTWTLQNVWHLLPPPRCSLVGVTVCGRGACRHPHLT